LRIEFRKAVLPDELRSLAAFDRKVFTSDYFPPSEWKGYECYWMLLEGRKIGCCAFEENLKEGTLYISTTGILPRFRGMGFGTLMKSWQVAYARRHGFARIVAHVRRQNAAMIALNKKFHFRIVRTIPRYYEDPVDSAVVMELAADCQSASRQASMSCRGRSG
jgi:ribosomal protein S18 acetylase RimI-like enzyme